MLSDSYASIDSSAMHRYFQKILDKKFWKDIPRDGTIEPLLMNELRQEAAMRAWVRRLNVEEDPPITLPDEVALQALGHDLDWNYGEDQWWKWAIWSTCAKCEHYETVQCDECRELVKFTELCEQCNVCPHEGICPYSDTASESSCICGSSYK